MSDGITDMLGNPQRRLEEQTEKAVTPPTPAGLHQALEEAEAAAAALPHPERHGLDGCHGCHLERALAKLRAILTAGADGETPTMKERFAAYLLTDSYLNSAIRERALRHFERATERSEQAGGSSIDRAPEPSREDVGSDPPASPPASPAAGEREREQAERCVCGHHRESHGDYEYDCGGRLWNGNCRMCNTCSAFEATLPPTPSVDTHMQEFERLVTAHGNATFNCGEFARLDRDDDSEYEPLLAIVRVTRGHLLDAIRELVAHGLTVRPAEEPAAKALKAIRYEIDQIEGSFDTNQCLLALNTIHRIVSRYESATPTIPRERGKGA